MNANQHEVMVQMWARGWRVKDMAKALENPVESILLHINKHREDFPKRLKPNRMTPEMHDLLVQLWADGYRTKDIAEMTGFSEGFLGHYCYLHRDEFPYRIPYYADRAKNRQNR